MRSSAVLMAVAVVVSASAAAAQDHPDFSGKWTLIADANAGGGGGGGGRGRGGMGGLGQEATITQDGSTLTITRTTQMGEVKSVYKLDGSDSKNTMALGGNSMESVSQAKWDGKKLVITTHLDFNGNAIETSMTLSLDESGNLVLESSNPGRGGGAAMTVAQKYKKG
jgi:hypothetical protein